jgi:hypothetical protein
MPIYVSTNRPFVSNKRTTVFAQMRRILNPITETTLKLVNEKPVLTGGAFLTFSTFFLSLISKSAVKILPFLGIPGIALLGYEIFSNLRPPTQTKKNTQMPLPQIFSRPRLKLVS